jgi:hypothetical protein
MVLFKKEFDDGCKKKFESDSKIGLLCSIAPDGYPHISLISSISVKDSATMMWGQFSQGLSKDYLKTNPKTGFLAVSPDKHWQTGKALHTGSVIKGEDFDYFNNKPLFRYNSYCGFGAVHYEQLIDVSVRQNLPLARIALGFLASGRIKKKVAKQNKNSAAPASSAQKMPLYGMNLASALACLKFVAYIDADGFPRLFPVMQGRPVDANTLVFAPCPYRELLREIPAGAKTAVFLASMSLESLLLQGRWNNIEKRGRLKYSLFEIDKVDNSMLPLCGYIYPPKTLPNVYGLAGE